ncbi:MAG: hypothetical protein WCJ72_11310 [Chryseobacterium sp.]
MKNEGLNHDKESLLMGMELSGSQIILEAFLQEGVKTIFGRVFPELCQV